jgi:hypothetical protein
MKRILMATVVLGLGVLVGCEEKKADNPLDKAKAAAPAATDKMKDMGKLVADKAADVTTALKGEVKNLVDTLKGKVDALAKGGDLLKPDQKAEFDKAVAGIKASWTDLSKSFEEAGSKTGDALAKGLADAKTAGLKLMETVKTTADKFGVKLN